MITRKLQCLLTEDDVLDRGRQLAQAEYDYAKAIGLSENAERSKMFSTSTTAWKDAH